MCIRDSRSIPRAMVHYKNIIAGVERLQRAPQPQSIVLREQQCRNRSHARKVFMWRGRTLCSWQLGCGRYITQVLRDEIRYWESSFGRFASAGGACTTVIGACSVKFSTVSDGSLICWPFVAACTPPPTPAPAAAPIAAPLPPPAIAPMMPPRIAPPPTFSAVFLPRELPVFLY